MSTSKTEPASSQGASPKPEAAEAAGPAAAASAPAPATAPVKSPADRPYSPGLEGVIAAETAIGYVDGANGRLLYRGYPIGQLVEKGTYGRVAELLWTGEWRKTARLVPAEVPEPVICVLRELPEHTHPMDALRTAVSVWGAWRQPHWPPTVAQAREITAFAPSALAAFHRLRQGLEPVKPNQKLSLAGGFLQQLTGKDPDPAAARALDAYFIVGAEHGLNASTFTCRVIISTRSDLASAVCGAIGCLKGPLHGGAPAEVVSQLHEIGSPERAEKWVREAIARGDKIMGFGHRVYRAYDPRAAALRKVAEGMSDMAAWLDTAVKVEDVVLRIFGELKPDRVIKTNVEYYAAAVLQGVGLEPDLFPPTFALARMAGWSAHAIEQASADKLIRPDARYVGSPETDVPAFHS
jgi:citrate synthase